MADPAGSDEVLKILPQDDNKYLVFTTDSDLPYSASVTVTIGPNLVSAEGPLLSDAKREIKFTTFAPFECSAVSTSSSDTKLVIHFTHKLPPLNTLTKKQMPRIEPFPPNFNAGVWTVTDNCLNFQCGNNSRLDKATNYVVSVPKGFPCVWGGVLPESAIFNVTTDRPRVMQTYPPQNSFLTDENLLILVIFNQSVKVDDTLKLISCQLLNPKAFSSNVVQIPLIKATENDVKNFSSIQLALANQHKKNKEFDSSYWICVKPKNALRSHFSSKELDGRKLTIQVGPKIPAKEGPMFDDYQYTLNLQIPEKLFIQITDRIYNPQDDLTFYFNHPITSSSDLSFDWPQEWIPIVTPALPPGKWIFTSQYKLTYTIKTANSTNNNNNNNNATNSTVPIVTWPGSTKYRFEFSLQFKTTLGGMFDKNDPDRILEIETRLNAIKFQYPETNSLIPTSPIFLVEFTQPVLPQKMVTQISFNVEGNLFQRKKDFASAILVDPSSERYTNLMAEVKSKRTISADPRHILVFIPNKEFPLESSITVRFNQISSEEGPLLNDTTRYYYHTQGSFSLLSPDLASLQKGYHNERWLIRFSQPIDEKSFDPHKMIICQPPLPNFSAKLNNKSAIEITTNLDPGKFDNEDHSYKITFTRDLRSNTGQHLSKQVQWKFTLTPETFPCAISAYNTSTYSNPILIHDPFVSDSTKKTPSYVIRTYNYKELRVVLYSIPHDSLQNDLKRWKSEIAKGVRQYISENSDSVDYVGGIFSNKKVFDSVVPVANFVPNQEMDFVVDLSPALSKDNFVGQVVVVVVPTMKAQYPNAWMSRKVIRTWLQCTRIGLEVLQSFDSFHIWATDIVTGKALAGVNCTVLQNVTGLRNTLRKNLSKLTTKEGKKKSTLKSGLLNS